MPFTRIILDSFRWRDSSVSSRVKLQLRGTTNDNGTVSSTWIWVQPSLLTPIIIVIIIIIIIIISTIIIEITYGTTILENTVEI